MKQNLNLIIVVVFFWVLCLSIGFMFNQWQRRNLQTQLITEAVAYPVKVIEAEELDLEPPQVLGIFNKSPVVSDKSYIEIKVNEELDTDGGRLQMVKFEDGVYTYRHLDDKLMPGINEFNLTLKDVSGNEIIQEYRITRFSVLECLSLNSGEIKEVLFPNALDTVVDKFHKIPEGYEPDGLLNGKNYGLPVMGSAYVRQIALDPLKTMIADIQETNINVIISSGWRGTAHQQRVYDYWVAQVGAGNAGKYAALPGFSEHHLGTAIDMLTDENGNTTTPQYENTRLGKWLKANAFKYGFVMSYPKGAEKITGYNYEPWHYRYVGTEHAVKIFELGLTPLEYFYQVNNINCE